MASANLPQVNTVGWYILEGYPWWPVYICDQYKLRPNLHQLGDGHKRILKKAKDFPKDYVIVYYFGSSEFSLVSLKKGVLKTWDCTEREQFLKGHPKHLVKKAAAADDLKVAIQLAEDFLSQPEDMRLPPNLVPSDLDPTLEPPPPMERPVEEDEEEEEDGEGGADDDEPMASDAEGGADDDDDAADEDMEEGGDEAEGKKKKKTKAKKSSSSSKKKEKDTKEKTKKEKKPAKEKKESSSKKKKNAAAEMEDGDAKTKGKLKRQRSANSGVGGGSEEKSPAAKKSKKDKAAADAKTPAVKKEESSGVVETTEDLSEVLEKEVRWILGNCQFEEMTTKMVRKLLEDRLKRDLRQHRETIKAVVTRVIDSMEEDEEGGAGGADAGVENGGDARTESSPTKANGTTTATTAAAVPALDKKEVAEPVKDEPTPEPVQEEAIPSSSSTSLPSTDKKEEEETSEPVKKEAVEIAAPQPTQPTTEEITATKLQQAKTELSNAADDESKILSVLKALTKLTTVDTTQLETSGILPQLVELRARRKQPIATAVSELAASWSAEELIPPPPPIQVDDILKMKETLVNPDTSHDELLASLTELGQMPLELSHLMDTGIARAVAGLRQHANDKVSIAAKELRNAWMQLADKDKQPNHLKKLEHMHEVLESESETGKAKLAVLQKLIKMSLTTKEIIDSKIGVMVSKLRKSDNPEIVAASNKLRKKWKSEVHPA